MAKQLITMFLAVVIFLSSGPTSFALSSKYTIDDLITSFAGEYTLSSKEETSSTEEEDKDKKEDKDKEKSKDSILPTWAVIQAVNSSAWEEPDGQEEKDAYRKKRDIATSVILGFGKASKYNAFKKDVEKYCEWSEEYQELVPKGTFSNEIKPRDLEVNQSKFDSLVRKFETAMSESIIMDLVDSDTTAMNNTSLGRAFLRITRGVTSFFAFTGLNLTKIAVSAMSAQMIIELLYLGVDFLRPILGFEIGMRRKANTARNENYLPGLENRKVYTDDHSTVFRIVGRAARLAVEQEYVIAEDMMSALQNNIFLCFIRNKFSQILIIVVASVLTVSGAWGFICTLFTRGIHFIF